MIIFRLEEFIKHKNLNIRSFEKLIGTSDGTIRNALKKERKRN